MRRGAARRAAPAVFAVAAAACGRGNHAPAPRSPPVTAGPPPAAAEPAPPERSEVQVLTLPSGRRVRVTAVTIPDSPHARSGRLVVAYEGARGPAAEVPGDGFGEPPRWRLRTDIPPDPLLQVESGYLGMGWACRWATLVRLGPEGPHAAAELRLAADNRSARTPPRVGYEATLLPAHDGFVAVYRGTVRRRIAYRAVGADYVARAPLVRDDC